jgi:hypothetical protein
VRGTGRLKKELGPVKGKALGGRSWRPNPSNGTTRMRTTRYGVKALAEAWHRATREGWCYSHVQAIIVAMDQYAEAALGNREFFLNKPYGIRRSRKDNIP